MFLCSCLLLVRVLAVGGCDHVLYRQRRYEDEFSKIISLCELASQGPSIYWPEAAKGRPALKDVLRQALVKASEETGAKNFSQLSPQEQIRQQQLDNVLRRDRSTTGGASIFEVEGAAGGGDGGQGGAEEKLGSPKSAGGKGSAGGGGGRGGGWGALGGGGGGASKWAAVKSKFKIGQGGGDGEFDTKGAKKMRGLREFTPHLLEWLEVVDAALKRSILRIRIRLDVVKLFMVASEGNQRVVSMQGMKLIGHAMLGLWPTTIMGRQELQRGNGRITSGDSGMHLTQFVDFSNRALDAAEDEWEFGRLINICTDRLTHFLAVDLPVSTGFWNAELEDSLEQETVDLLTLSRGTLSDIVLSDTANVSAYGGEGLYSMMN